MLEVDVEVRRGAFGVRAAFASDAPIVALFGRSGAGKSTLVNAIAGIVRPERGRIVTAAYGQSAKQRPQPLQLARSMRAAGGRFAAGSHGSKNSVIVSAPAAIQSDVPDHA